MRSVCVCALCFDSTSASPVNRLQGQCLRLLQKRSKLCYLLICLNTQQRKHPSTPAIDLPAATDASYDSSPITSTALDSFRTTPVHTRIGSAGLLSIRNALERTIAQEESLQERLNTTLPANNDEARPTDILDSLLFGMDPCNLAGSIHPDTVTLSHVEALFRANNFSPWVVPKLETLQFLQMKFNSFPALIEAVGRVEPNLDLVSPKFFAAFPFLSSPPSANMETSSPAQLNETEMFKANNVLAAKSLTSEEFKGKVDIEDGQQLAFYLSYLHDHDAQRSTGAAF